MKRLWLNDEYFACFGVLEEPWWQLLWPFSQRLSFNPLGVGGVSIPIKFGWWMFSPKLPAEQTRPTPNASIVRKFNKYPRFCYWRWDVKSTAINIKNAVWRNFRLQARACHSAVHNRIVFVVDDIIDSAFPLDIPDRENVAVVDDRKGKIKGIFRIGGDR